LKNVRRAYFSGKMDDNLNLKENGRRQFLGK
jgi:hypothetical protein